MYDRVARELESERAAARSLRRELDAVQAQTAEHRRVDLVRGERERPRHRPTTRPPPPLPPAGWPPRAAPRSGRAAARRRAEAARAASAHRVPTHAVARRHLGRPRRRASRSSWAC